jgi:hypothetical protein
MGSSRKTTATSRNQGRADLQIPVSVSLTCRFIPSLNLLKLNIPTAENSDRCGVYPFQGLHALRQDSVNWMKSTATGEQAVVSARV